MKAKLHDGSTIDLEIHGHGPTLLAPLDPQPAGEERARELRQWGVDPARGRRIVDGLADRARVVAFDYEGHVLENPKPDTLTADNLVADLLSVADAAGAETFAYFGYSWTAMAGMQLALRTTRVSALAMGGFPPLDGPYDQMLRITTAAYDLARGARIATDTDSEWSGNSLSKGQTRQFVTLYRSLQGFDDTAAQSRLTCPRLCFAGDADDMTYGEDWGDVHVDIGGTVTNHLAELEALGWEVHLLQGLDHLQAMQADHVVPLLRDWLPRAFRPG